MARVISGPGSLKESYERMKRARTEALRERDEAREALRVIEAKVETERETLTEAAHLLRGTAALPTSDIDLYDNLNEIADSIDPNEALSKTATKLNKPFGPGEMRPDSGIRNERGAR